MFFIIARCIQSLVLPPASLLILMAVGFAIIRHKRQSGRALIAAGFLGFYLLSLGSVSDVLNKPLEQRALTLQAERPGPVQAIVVLGGGVRDLAWTGLAPEPSETSLERLVKGVERYRDLHVPLVLVGGSGDPAKPSMSEADAMAQTAASLGVPRGEIILANKARNTKEGAQAVKELFKNGDLIVLVTSAYHMKRSTGIFKKQGFNVLPAPAGFRAEQRTLFVYSFFPRSDNFYYSCSALAEYLSLAWYTASNDL